MRRPRGGRARRTSPSLSGTEYDRIDRFAGVVEQRGDSVRRYAVVALVAVRLGLPGKRQISPGRENRPTKTNGRPVTLVPAAILRAKKITERDVRLTRMNLTAAFSP